MSERPADDEVEKAFASMVSAKEQALEAEHGYPVSEMWVDASGKIVRRQHPGETGEERDGRAR